MTRKKAPVRRVEPPAPEPVEPTQNEVLLAQTCNTLHAQIQELGQRLARLEAAHDRTDGRVARVEAQVHRTP